MRPSTHQPISGEKITSTAGSVATATIPNKTSAILVTVETNAVRVTLDGTDPSAGTGVIVQKDNNPWHMLVGVGTTLRMSSITGNAVMQLIYLN